MSIVSRRVWKENGILSFIDLFFCFLEHIYIRISYKQCIENNNKIYD